jgi:hypothetical protein
MARTLKSAGGIGLISALFLVLACGSMGFGVRKSESLEMGALTPEAVQRVEMVARAEVGSLEVALTEWRYDATFLGGILVGSVAALGLIVWRMSRNRTR